VTILPATILVRDEPITTIVCMSATAGSKSSRVAMPDRSPPRDASRTQPTGVPAGRYSARMASARGSCQVRAWLAGFYWQTTRSASAAARSPRSIWAHGV